MTLQHKRSANSPKSIWSAAQQGQASAYGGQPSARKSLVADSEKHWQLELEITPDFGPKVQPGGSTLAFKDRRTAWALLVSTDHRHTAGGRAAASDSEPPLVYSSGCQPAGSGVTGY